MVEVSKPSAATLVTRFDRNSRHPKFVRRNWREGCKISIKKKLNVKLAKLCTIVIGWFFPIFQPLQCHLFFPRGALRRVILSFARNVKKNDILTEYLLSRCSRLWIVDSCRLFPELLCFKPSPKRLRSLERTRDDFRSRESFLAWESETSDGGAGFDSQVLPRNAMWQWALFQNA